MGFGIFSMGMRTIAQTPHPTFFCGDGGGGGGGGQQRGIAPMNTKTRPITQTHQNQGALEARATFELLGSDVS